MAKGVTILREVFNDSSMEKRSTILCRYGKWVDFRIEPGYYYHLYAVNTTFIMVQYCVTTESVLDIWMLSQQEVEEFCEVIDIDNLWK